MRKKEEMNSKKENGQEKRYPNCFMDLEVKGVFLGRIEFELFDDCPVTAENFRCLCTGEAGMGASGFPLHYKGSHIH